jgi:hypothetical protein
VRFFSITSDVIKKLVLDQPAQEKEQPKPSDHAGRTAH